jgi:hypothetical protein
MLVQIDGGVVRRHGSSLAFIFFNSINTFANERRKKALKVKRAFVGN